MLTEGPRSEAEGDAEFWYLDCDASEVWYVKSVLAWSIPALLHSRVRAAAGRLVDGRHADARLRARVA